jgi:hypothetical protein
MHWLKYIHETQGSYYMVADKVKGALPLLFKQSNPKDSKTLADFTPCNCIVWQGMLQYNITL